MSEFLRKYVSFVIHPFHTIEESGVEVFPQIYNQAIGFTIIFSALHKLTPFLLSTFYPSWYKQLEPAKRREMPTYLVSFAHHLIAVPIAWLHIYQDYQQLQSGAPMVANHYALKESFLVPFGCAFLFADILNYAFDEALSGRPMYLLHHALALALGIAVIAVAPGSYLRLVPHFLICETTNIFFNIAWVLRAAGMKGNPFVLLFEYLFALTFFPIRIINLTLVIWLLQAEGSSLGAAKYALHPIGAMQYYWFYKIVSMLRTRYESKDSKKVGKVTDDNDLSKEMESSTVGKKDD